MKTAQNLRFTAALAALAMAATGCQRQGTPAGADANPPPAVTVAASDFSGLAPAQIRYTAVPDGFAAAYQQGGRAFDLNIDPNGRINRVSETVRYRPYGATAANVALAAAASPAENLIEAVIAANRANQQQALGDLDRAIGRLRTVVPATAVTPLADVLASAKAADAANDSFGLGIAAASLYRKLQEAQDLRGAPVPLGVALLDHAGFTSELLLTMPTPDWSAAGGVARDAAAQLAAIRPSLGDANLAAMTGSIVGRLQAGVAAHNVVATRSASQELLAMVDLLEQYYDGAYKVRGV